MLNISDTLELPPEAMTLTSAVLGIRGSGKTNTAVVFSEELLEIGQQVIIIDPLDVWWGLKSSADGNAPGYSVVILGGVHGDLPLGSESGAVVADFLVENRTPAILSLRHLRKGEQKRFVADFCEQLYQKKGQPGHATPVLVIIDEASSFVPQSFQGDTARSVGAVEDLVRRGRASGIGVMLIDQRAASVNKDVLTQLELLAAHRHTSPQDRNALKLWIQAHDTGGQEKAFMTTLAILPQGEAWFWSPSWLNIFERVLVRKRRTFDSSATPKLGEAIVAPTAQAEINLEALKDKLAATIESATQNDPTALKKRVQELEKKLATKAPETKEVRVDVPVEVRVEVPVISPELTLEFRRRADALSARADDLIGMAKDLTATAQNLNATAQQIRDGVDRVQVIPAPSAPQQSAPAEPKETPAPKEAPAAMPASALRHSPYLVALLDAPEGMSLQKLMVASGMALSPQDVIEATLRAEIRNGRLMFSDDTFRLTEKGRTTVTGAKALKGPVLLEHYAGHLNVPQGRILHALVHAYPRSMTSGELASVTGYVSTSGAWKKAVKEIRALPILADTGGKLSASKALMDFIEGI